MDIPDKNHSSDATETLSQRIRRTSRADHFPDHVGRDHHAVFSRYRFSGTC